MKERDIETRFVWPEDGSSFNLTRGVLKDISVPEVLDNIIPDLTGKAVLAAWMIVTEADADAVRMTLNIGDNQLRAYCGVILEAAQRYSGDTYIVDSGDTER